MSDLILPVEMLADTIELEPGTIPIHVAMAELPGKVVYCQPTDKVFLFTSGILTCIAAVIHCQLKDGGSLLGVGHIIYHCRDTFHQVINEGKQVKDLFSKDLLEEKLLGLLVALTQHKQYAGEAISVYLIGGWGNQFAKMRQHKYSDYINCLKSDFNIVLRGVLYDVFEINEQTQQLLGTSNIFKRAALTVGIDSKGQLSIAKSFNVIFGHNACYYPTIQSLEEYAKKPESRYQRLAARFDNPLDPNNNVDGFKELTINKLRMYEYCFQMEGLCCQLADMDPDLPTLKAQTTSSPLDNALSFRIAAIQRLYPSIRTLLYNEQIIVYHALALLGLEETVRESIDSTRVTTGAYALCINHPSSDVLLRIKNRLLERGIDAFIGANYQVPLFAAEGNKLIIEKNPFQLLQYLDYITA